MVRKKDGALSKIDRKALEHFSNGPGLPPSGAGRTTIFSLTDQKYIERTESPPDDLRPRFRITTAGLNALLADKQISN